MNILHLLFSQGCKVHHELADIYFELIMEHLLSNEERTNPIKLLSSISKLEVRMGNHALASQF